MNKVAKLVFGGAFLMLLSSCTNQNEESTRHFCDNEKALLFPYYQEPWDSTFNINWDLSLSMDELYKSAVAQTGEDTCSGGRVYASRIKLSDENYVFISTEISKRHCPCCPQRPPGLRAVPLHIHIISDSITLVDWDTIHTKNLESALASWTRLSRINMQNRHITFELQWLENVAEHTLKAHIMALIESYVNFLKLRTDWVDDEICAQDVTSEIEEGRFPKFVLFIEGVQPPPPPPPPIQDSLIHSGNMD